MDTPNSTIVHMEGGGERLHMPHVPQYEIERAHCRMINNWMAVTFLHGGIMNPNSSDNNTIPRGGKQGMRKGSWYGMFVEREISIFYMNLRNMSRFTSLKL